MTKTAIIYARVSTDDQQDNYSLPSQIRACRDYAEQHGYTVIGEFQEAFTGTTLDRPQLNEIAKRAGTFDVLVVHSVSRLSRDPVDLLVFNDRLEDAGTAIKFVNDAVDTSTDLGKVMLHLEGLGAKKYREAMLEAMRRGKREKVRSGKVSHTSVSCYGYRYENNALVIYEPEAQVVRSIFDWYVYGDETETKLAAGQIASKLTSMKVPTRYEQLGRQRTRHLPGVWSPSTITKMLSNEVYVGRWLFGANKAGHKHVKADPVEVAVPAIIDPEVFALARITAEKNKKYASRNTRYDYLLRSRCRCAKCGYLYYGRTEKRGKQRGYYQCQGTNKYRSPDLQEKQCSGTVRQDILEAQVWLILSEFIRDPESIKDAIREQQQRHAENAAVLQSYIDGCEQQLKELEQYRRDLVDNFLRKRIPEDIYEEKLPETERKIAATRAKLADYCVEVQRGYNPPSEAAIDEWCAFLADKVDIATPDQKRGLIELLDVQIFLDRENELITVEGFLPTVTTHLQEVGYNLALAFSLRRKFIA